MNASKLKSGLGTSPVVFYVCLPGVIFGIVVLLFLPLAIMHLSGVHLLIGAAAQLPWWGLLIRGRKVAMMLFLYLMPVVALLGWGAFALLLHRAGVY